MYWSIDHTGSHINKYYLTSRQSPLFESLLEMKVKHVCFEANTTGTLGFSPNQKVPQGEFQSRFYNAYICQNIYSI